MENQSSFEWDFGFGATNTTAANPTRTFPDAGNYDVSLTVFSDDANCEVVFTKEVLLYPEIVPDFDFVKETDHCSLEPVLFVNNTIGGSDQNQYEWIFNDNSANYYGFEPPPHVFNAFGAGNQNFNVTLIVTNPLNGCTNEISRMVTVRRRPDANLIGTPQNPVTAARTIRNCSQASQANPTFDIEVSYSPSVFTSNINYHIVSEPDGVVIWDSDQAPTVANPATHQYTELGVFDLIFTVTSDTGCDDVRVYQVLNISNPGGSLENPGGSTGCGPIVFPFIVGASPNNHSSTTYTLYFGDGQSATYTQSTLPDTIFHEYTISSCTQTNAENYSVTLDITNQCKTTSFLTDGIEVWSGPNPYSSLPNMNGCLNSQITFPNNTSAAWGPECSNEVWIEWDFGDGTQLPSQPYNYIYHASTQSYSYHAPSHTYTEPGIYTVSLSAYNNCNINEPEEGDFEVCIEDDLVADFSLASPAEGCASHNVVIINNTEEASICNNNSYSWTVEKTNGSDCTLAEEDWAFLSGGQYSVTPSFIFHNPGEYVIRMRFNNNCALPTFHEETVIIKGPPVLNSLEGVESGCAPLSINPSVLLTPCNADVDPLTGFSWQFPGGQPVSSEAVSPGEILFETSGDYYVTVTATNECGISNELSANLFASSEISGNIIALPSDDFICQGQLPDIITGTIAPDLAGGDGAYTFEWEMSTTPDFSASSSIGGNTADLEVDQQLFETTYFRRIVYSGGCMGISNILEVLVVPGIINNNISEDQSICAGSVPDLLTGELPAGGSTEGSYLFQWQQNTVPETNWSDIDGATQISFQPPALHVSKMYRRLVNANPPDDCESASLPVTITVNPIPEITSGLENFICSGQSVDYIPTSSVPGSVINWNVVNDYAACIQGVASNSGNGAINHQLVNVCEAIQTVTYQMTPVGPTGCFGNMAELNVEVNPQLTIVLTPDNPNPGYGTWTHISATITGGTGDYSISWTGGSISEGQGTPQITTGSLFANTQYTLQVTDESGCVASASILLLVSSNQPSLTATADPDPICIGSSSVLTAQATGGSGSFTYQWYDPSNNPVLPEGQNQVVVEPLQTTSYTVIANDGFNPPLTASVTVNVNTTPEITSPLVWEICSQTGVDYHPQSNVSGTTFEWILNNTASDCIESFGGEGQGAIESILVNNCLVAQTVIYTVIPTGPEPPAGGCPGVAEELTVTVNPYAHIIDTDDSQTTISGAMPNPTHIEFSSDVAENISFIWSTVGNENLEDTYPLSGQGDLVFHQPFIIRPEGNETEILEYSVFPVYNGVVQDCPGQEFIYTVIVQQTPSLFSLSGGGVFCDDGINCLDVTLEGSQDGVLYQLRRGNLNVGIPIPGNINGDPLVWPCLKEPGTYSVMGINQNTGAQIFMNGNVLITSRELPVAYLLYDLEPGVNCLPITPWLNGSQEGVFYTLSREFNGILYPDLQQITGTGSPLTFDVQEAMGNYSITANLDHGDIVCTRPMNGTITTRAIPEEFPIAPQGIVCEGAEEICLEASEPGVIYRLWKNDQWIDQINGDADGGAVCFNQVLGEGAYQIQAVDQSSLCEIFFEETIVIESSPLSYLVFPEEGCQKSEIFMNNCQPGMHYFLYLETVSKGVKEYTEVAGPLTCDEGTGVNFGIQVLEGIYHVKAVNSQTNCSAWMKNTVRLWSTPQVYTMAPQGVDCPPAVLSLTGSQQGYSYGLYRNGNMLYSLEGTGGALDFGSQSLPGVYTIKAVASHQDTLSCWENMNGSFEILIQPELFSLKPVLPVCSSVQYHLSSSQEGIVYELWNNQLGIMQSKPGSGSVLYFDTVEHPGEYWVIAKSASCELQMDGVRTLLPPPNVYSITPQGTWCEQDNFSMGISNSEVGFIYELHALLQANNPQALLSGNGDAMVFDSFEPTVGVYRVKAIDEQSGCTVWMNGQVIVNPMPEIYNITANGIVSGAGLYCPGVEIGLQYAVEGVQYRLNIPHDSPILLTGQGASLSFGTFYNPGIYSVDAIHPETLCTVSMQGTIQIDTGPEVFSLTSSTIPAYFCQGDDSAISLMLTSSSPGVSYQLYKDTDTNPVAEPVSGTGTLISWDHISQFGAGTYFVISSFTDDPVCTSAMQGFIEVEEVFLPSASLKGEMATCSGYETEIQVELDSYKELVVELLYSANNILQPPLIMHPVNEIYDFTIYTAPTENTTFEVQKVEYIELQGCYTDGNGEKLLVEVEPTPVVHAGNSVEICVTGSYDTQPILEMANDPVWRIINGKGELLNENNLTATYLPHWEDAGDRIILEIEVSGSGTCSEEITSDVLYIDVKPLPEINMGESGIICETGLYETQVAVEYGSAYHWSILSGNGVLASNSELNTIYSAADGDAGTEVRLALQVAGEGVCSMGHTEAELLIEVTPLPEVFAGNNTIMCAESNLYLEGLANYHDSSEVSWQVIPSEGGTFDDPGRLDPIFTSSYSDSLTTVELRLTVSGHEPCEYESVSSAMTIEVHPLPRANAGQMVSTCVSAAVEISAATAAHYSSITWELIEGAGILENYAGLHPTYIPHEGDAGQEVVLKLIAFGKGICEDSHDEDLLTIQIDPLPEVTTGTFLATCVSQPIAIPADYVTTHNVSDLQWRIKDFSGNGIIHGYNSHTPTYIPHPSDIGKTVVLEVTAYGKSSCHESFVTEDLEIKVGSEAVPWFTIINNQLDSTMCANSKVHFNDLSGFHYHQSHPEQFISRRIWEFSNANGYYELLESDGETDIAHIFPEAGIFEVSLTIETMIGNQVICTSNDQLNVLIYKQPHAEFATYMASNCRHAVQFEDLSHAQTGAIRNWFWDFGGGYYSSVTNPVFEYQSGGTKQATLQVTDQRGCKNDFTMTFYLDQTFDYQIGHESFCFGQETVFYVVEESVLPEGNAINQFRWSFSHSDELGFDPMAFHTYDQPGKYQVTLEATDQTGCSKTKTISVAVPERLTPGFWVEDCDLNVAFRLAPTMDYSSIDEWIWDFGDGNSQNISQDHPPVVYHTYQEDGVYSASLTVIDSLGCQGVHSNDTIKTLCIERLGFYVPTAFAPDHSNAEVKVFKPKGVHIEEYQIRVLDLWGNQVWESSLLDEGSPVESWDGTYRGSPLPSGVYVWNAYVRFIDGTLWENDNSDAKNSGTVTIIR